MKTTYFRKRGSKDDDLVNLAHLCQEMIDAGTFNDINVVRLRFNLDRDDIIGGR